VEREKRKKKKRKEKRELELNMTAQAVPHATFGQGLGGGLQVDAAFVAPPMPMALPLRTNFRDTTLRRRATEEASPKRAKATARGEIVIHSPRNWLEPLGPALLVELKRYLANQRIVHQNRLPFDLWVDILAHWGMFCELAKVCNRLDAKISVQEFLLRVLEALDESFFAKLVSLKDLGEILRTWHLPAPFLELDEEAEEKAGMTDRDSDTDGESDNDSDTGSDTDSASHMEAEGDLELDNCEKDKRNLDRKQNQEQGQALESGEHNDCGERVPDIYRSNFTLGVVKEATCVTDTMNASSSGYDSEAQDQAEFYRHDGSGHRLLPKIHQGMAGPKLPSTPKRIENSKQCVGSPRSHSSSFLDDLAEDMHQFQCWDKDCFIEEFAHHVNGPSCDLVDGDMLSLSLVTSIFVSVQTKQGALTPEKHALLERTVSTLCDRFLECKGQLNISLSHLSTLVNSVSLRWNASLP